MIHTIHRASREPSLIRSSDRSPKYPPNATHVTASIRTFQSAVCHFFPLPILPLFLSIPFNLVTDDSYWQCELLSLHHFGVINPEEVRIQHSLNQSCHNTNPILMSLYKISPDPIRNVECPITSQCEQIMRGDCLCLSGSLQQEELG